MFENLTRFFRSTRPVELRTNAPRALRARAKPVRGEQDAQAGMQEVAAFMRSRGLRTGLAARIHERYGEGSLRALESPYRLLRDMPDLGFARVDRMARALGVAAEARSRIEAGIHYAVQEAIDEGHSFILHPDLVVRASKLLKLDTERIIRATRRMDLFGDFVVEDQRVYPRPLYEAELNSARRLHRALTSRYSKLAGMTEQDWSGTISFVARKNGKLNRQERAALIAARRFKLSILAVGPECDGMKAVRTLIGVLKANGSSWRLAAPSRTGARRAGRAAEQRAETLQHLLAWKPLEAAPRHHTADTLRGGICSYTRSNPVDADFVILAHADELDLLWFDALLAALHPSTHLLLVGNPNVIPPFGPGLVLRDLIDSGAIAVTRVEQSSTASEENLIAANARLILSGDKLLAPRTAQDFFILKEDDPVQAAARVVDTVKTWLPNKFDLDPHRDIRVLCAGDEGALGTTALNAALQAMLNPPTPEKAEKRHGKRVFRTGDPVVQFRTDYWRRVGAGEEGRITAIRSKSKLLTVDFGGQVVDYPFAALDSLALGYAVDITSARSSQHRAVVIPILNDQPTVFDRQRLYTALACAAERVVLIGTRHAIDQAIKTPLPPRRSRLAVRIKELHRHSSHPSL